MRKEFPKPTEIEKEFKEDYNRIIVFHKRLGQWFEKWLGSEKHK